MGRRQTFPFMSVLRSTYPVEKVVTKITQISFSCQEIHILPQKDSNLCVFFLRQSISRIVPRFITKQPPPQQPWYPPEIRYKAITQSDQISFGLHSFQLK